MPRPSKKTVTEATTAPVEKQAPVAPVVEQVAQPVVEKKAPRKRSKAADTTAPPAEQPSATEAVPTPATETPVADSVPAEEVKHTKQRAVHTRETVLRDFAECISYLTTEIDASRATSGKSANTKTLRTVLTKVKDLQRATGHAIKQKPTSQRKNNNSGFLKPVQISPEIAKFTGFDASQLHSRVDVNNFICEYIKSKNLQNPEDRRQIVPDEKLAKVIGYKHGVDSPLTYPTLQKFMKSHYPKTEKVSA